MERKNKRKHIELLALVAGTIQPIFTIPQIVTVFHNQSAQDVSLLTWSGYTLLGLIMLIYAITFRLRPIIVGQTIWLLLQGSMVVGILMYQ